MCVASPQLGANALSGRNGRAEQSRDVQEEIQLRTSASCSCEEEENTGRRDLLLLPLSIHPSILLSSLPLHLSSASVHRCSSCRRRRHCCCCSPLQPDILL